LNKVLVRDGSSLTSPFSATSLLRAVKHAKEA